MKNLLKLPLIRGLLVLFFLDAAALASATAQDKVRFFSHGEGAFGWQRKEGTFVGPGVDVLRCSMEKLKKPFSINQATMVRKARLAQEGVMDAWFPSLIFENMSRTKRIAYPIGKMPIYWYVPKRMKVAPDTPEFMKLAKVSAFPGSTPARILKAHGYKLQPGTDDENKVVLWLLNGRLDGFLSAAFDGLLKPGARSLLDARIDRTLYRNFDAGVEFTELFVRQHPGFVSQFQSALTSCQQ